jgi:Mrp family chromosome partitioning ATPase
LDDVKASGTEEFIYPVETEDGIKVMSLNFLVNDESDPVIWRGPVIGNMVKQFWTYVLWEDLVKGREDFRFILPMKRFRSLVIHIAAAARAATLSMFLQK